MTTLTTKSSDLYDALKSRGVEAKPTQSGGTDVCEVPLGNGGRIQLFRAQPSDNWHLGFFNPSVDPKDKGVHLMAPKTDDPEQIAQMVYGIIERVQGNPSAASHR